MTELNSFGAATTLTVGDKEYRIYALSALETAGFQTSRIPYCIRILLENLLRYEDGRAVKRSDIEYVAKW